MYVAVPAVALFLCLIAAFDSAAVATVRLYEVVFLFTCIPRELRRTVACWRQLASCTHVFACQRLPRSLPLHRIPPSCTPPLVQMLGSKRVSVTVLSNARSYFSQTVVRPHPCCSRPWVFIHAVRCVVLAVVLAGPAVRPVMKILVEHVAVLGAL
jgi:hypothetical protein